MMFEIASGVGGGKWVWTSLIGLPAVIFAIDPAISVSAIAVAGTIVTAYFSYRQAKTEKRVDANQLFVDQLQEQLGTERGRNDVIEERLHAMQREISHLRVQLTNYQIGVATLSNQVTMLGEIPAWEPPSKE